MGKKQIGHLNNDVEEVGVMDGAATAVSIMPVLLY